MRGAIPTVPNASSWRGDKHRDNFNVFEKMKCQDMNWTHVAQDGVQ